MPLKVSINDNEKWIYPTDKWQNLTLVNKKINFKIDDNFYIYAKDVK